jgi:hypothetical protein
MSTRTSATSQHTSGDADKNDVDRYDQNPVASGPMARLIVASLAAGSPLALSSSWPHSPLPRRAPSPDPSWWPSASLGGDGLSDQPVHRPSARLDRRSGRCHGQHGCWARGLHAAGRRHARDELGLPGHHPNAAEAAATDTAIDPGGFPGATPPRSNRRWTHRNNPKHRGSTPPTNRRSTCPPPSPPAAGPTGSSA